MKYNVFTDWTCWWYHWVQWTWTDSSEEQSYIQCYWGRRVAIRRIIAVNVVLSSWNWPRLQQVILYKGFIGWIGCLAMFLQEAWYKSCAPLAKQLLGLFLGYLFAYFVIIKINIVIMISLYFLSCTRWSMQVQIICLVKTVYRLPKYYRWPETISKNFVISRVLFGTAAGLVV